MKSHVWITGASGYLGGHLVWLVLSLGFVTSTLIETSPLANFDYSVAKGVSIRRFKTKKDIENCIMLCKPDVVIHAACIYGKSVESNFEMRFANYEFGVSLLSAVEKLDKRSFFLNCHTALNPDVSVYSQLKHDFYNCTKSGLVNVAWAHLCPEYIFGPFETGKKFIAYVARSCYSHVELLELTEGQQL